MLRKHVGLNYSFNLNQNSFIDSARVGNETRYINHGSGNNANAAARSAHTVE
jgi:SET domain-containing protein